MLRRIELSLCTLILLGAAWLRLDRLGDVPPGWRDDEVVETTVHAALVLAGDAPLYFPQAEGQEPLYHYLSAGWIALAGRSLFSVRLVSAFLGVLSVAALYRLARRLFGPAAALLAAAGLALSFWGLMYSRFKLRHVAEVAPMLLAMEAFWRAGELRRKTKVEGRTKDDDRRRTTDDGRQTADRSRRNTQHVALSPQRSGAGLSPQRSGAGLSPQRSGAGLSPKRSGAGQTTHDASRITKGERPSQVEPAPTRWWAREGRWPAEYKYALIGGLWLAAALYTYYAARVVPAILVAFLVYLALFHRKMLQALWRPWALGLGVAAALSLPLWVAIARTPGGEARLAVVGAPLQALLRGDPGLALANTVGTLGMAAFTGDPEALYNIPGRPVFDPLGALLFAAGLGLSVWRWRQPRHALMLLWLAGGLAPAFLSVPAASLGHTIAAQPAFYLLPAIGLAGVAVAAREWPSGPFVTVGLSLAFLLVTGLRDIRDYFVRWRALPEVRRLYRADLHDAAPGLRALPAGSPLGLASYNLHPADALALGLETPGRDLQPRPFNPAWAWLWPAADEPVLLLGTSPADGAFGVAGPAGHFEVRSSRNPAYAAPEAPLEAAFANGWTCTGYTLRRKADAVTLDTYWRVDEGYVPPAPRPVEVISGTPLPLKFFSHVLNADGSVLAGDDRLELDPAYLRAGDEFIQRFQLALPVGLAAGDYVAQVGLYDPASGARVPLANGEDRLVLTTMSVP